MVCDLYALSVIEQDKRGSSSTVSCRPNAPRPSRAASTTAAAPAPVRGDTGRRVRIPEQLRYAEMLHPENIVDTSTCETSRERRRDATSAGTIGSEVKRGACEAPPQHPTPARLGHPPHSAYRHNSPGSLG